MHGDWNGSFHGYHFGDHHHVGDGGNSYAVVVAQCGYFGCHYGYSACYAVGGRSGVICWASLAASFVMLFNNAATRSVAV